MQEVIYIDCINFDLSEELDDLEIHTFADLHIGDVHSDEKDIIERIKYVENTPNAYIVLNGDLMNNATKTSISDNYAEKIPPMEQIARIVDIFAPVKDRIIAVTSGNHENRTYIKEGIDIMAFVCAQFDISERYAKNGAFIFLRFGNTLAGGERKGARKRKMCYTIYCIHGSGGGRKEGAKAIRLADMASIVDADIYIHSHTHLPMVMKQSFYRSDVRTHTVHQVDKLFVNTASSLKYGGYGQAFEFKPSSIATPTIYLSSNIRNMYAKL